ncbi:hypothetical protein KIPB_012835, partial [Kipferlia bialata]
KRRAVWHLKWEGLDVEGCIDRVDGLDQDWLELECCVPPVKRQETEAALTALMGRMGLSVSDAVRTPYIAMLRAQTENR